MSGFLNPRLTLEVIVQFLCSTFPGCLKIAANCGSWEGKWTEAPSSIGMRRVWLELRVRGVTGLFLPALYCMYPHNSKPATPLGSHKHGSLTLSTHIPFLGAGGPPSICSPKLFTPYSVYLSKPSTQAHLLRVTSMEEVGTSK